MMYQILKWGSFSIVGILVVALLAKMLYSFLNDRESFKNGVKQSLEAILIGILVIVCIVSIGFTFIYTLNSLIKP